MKIDRLIGILSILLQKDKVTAPYLAEKFEVSRRTINRDIEDICKAGIPLITMQGANGGISIAEGYKLDKTLLTANELQSILDGLKSLDSFCGTLKYQQLMDKLSVESHSHYPANGHIFIDLASYYKNSLAPKIELIQNAIEHQKYISFQYYAPAGDTLRTIEPYLIVYEWADWYVWGYCIKRNDYRLFKLNRLWDLTISKENRPIREVPTYEPDIGTVFPETYKVTALFQPAVKWKLIEEYGHDCYSTSEDGRLLFSTGFASEESLMNWILGFGNQIEVVAPSKLKDKLRHQLQLILNQYL